MPYGLDEFVADCRAILIRDSGPAGREDVRQHLERLLTNELLPQVDQNDAAANEERREDKARGQ